MNYYIQSQSTSINQLCLKSINTYNETLNSLTNYFVIYPNVVVRAFNESATIYYIFVNDDKYTDPNYYYIIKISSLAINDAVKTKYNSFNYVLEINQSINSYKRTVDFIIKTESTMNTLYEPLSVCFEYPIYNQDKNCYLKYGNNLMYSLMFCITIK